MAINVVMEAGRLKVAGLPLDELLGFGAAGGYLRSDGTAWLRTSGVAWADLTGVPATFTPSAHTHPLADITDFGAAGGYIRSNGSAWLRVSGVAWGDLTSLPAFATRWPTWSEVTDKPATFAPTAHVLATTAGLGAEHTTSGLTAGQVLRATAATTAAFQSLIAADIPSLDAAKINAGFFSVARGGTGLATVTVGNFLRGNGTTAFNQSTPAQVLTDIGAAAASHNHGLANITDFGAAAGYIRSNGSAWVRVSGVAWGDLTGVPATFAPSAHTHVIGDVTGLQTALDGKLSLTGGTLEASSGMTNLILQKAALSDQANLSYNNEAGVVKWRLGTTSNTEDNFFLARFNDAGVFQESSIAVDSTTGLITLGNELHTNSIINIGYATAGEKALTFANASGDVDLLLNSAATSTGLYRRSGTPGWLWRVQVSDGELLEGIVPWARLTNVPATFAPSAHTHPWGEITSQPTTLSGTVNLTGDQTVAGVKTFSSDIVLTDHRLIRGSVSYLTQRSNSDGGVGINFQTNQSTNRGAVYATTEGIGFLNAALAWAVRFNLTGEMEVGTVPWARLTSVPTSLSNTVNLTGDQTVAGQKTFSSRIVPSASISPVIGTSSSLQGTVLYPHNAAIRSASSTQTGALKIRLPALHPNTMIRMRVEFYTYGGRSVTYMIEGYPYSSSSTWANQDATAIGDPDRIFSVRFGNDGVGNCVWIGELATVWSYPFVRVAEVMVSHSSVDFTTGWVLTWETAFDTVQFTVAPHKFVSDTGAQTIAGIKTFTDGIKLGANHTLSNTNTDHFSHQSNHATAVGMALKTSQGTIRGFLYAQDTGIGFLGSASTWTVRFDNDGAMTVGTVPWARLTSVPTSLSNTVNLTGNQTIAGVKTFSSSVVSPGMNTSGALTFNSTANSISITANVTTTVNGNSGVILNHNGGGSAFTRLYNAASETSGLEIRKHDGTYYDAGFNVLPIAYTNTGNTLLEEHCGGVYLKNNATAITLTLQSNLVTTFPVGGVTTVINSNTAGNITVNEGATTTLYYLSGATRTDTAGGCTVGPGGVATVWRESATVYLIWGSGITP